MVVPVTFWPDAAVFLLCVGISDRPAADEAEIAGQIWAGGKNFLRGIYSLREKVLWDFVGLTQERLAQRVLA